MDRSQIIKQHYFKLGLMAALVAIICILLAFSLKYLTESFEHLIFYTSKIHSPALFIVLPSLGITIIYFLRKYLFQNKKIKG